MNSLDPVILLALFLLGGLGSMIRLKLSEWNGYIPWGILTANIVASFIAGFAYSATKDEALLLLVVIGFAGGLSTFSSWAAGTVHLAAKRKILAPTLYTLLTLALSSTAAYLGLLLG